MHLSHKILIALIHSDQILHNWARILGQVGYKLVPSQPDHSHANLAWNDIANRLEGREFEAAGNVYNVAFSIDKNVFEMIGEGQILRSIPTNDIPIRQVVSNLETHLSQLRGVDLDLARDLEFRFPKWINDKDISDTVENADLQLWEMVRSGANQVLQNTLRDFQRTGEVRIWATNFDTGIFCDFDDGLHQYAGFAPADAEVCEKPYFYNSFYKNNKRIYPRGYKNLHHGYWETKKWAGAVLPISEFETSEVFMESANGFLSDSTKIFLKNNDKV